MSELKKLYDAILNGNVKSAVALTKQAIAENCDPAEVINGTMIPAMSEVGRLYEQEEYFVPEMLLSARAMKSALELLRPLLANSGVEPTGRVVIGTVAGDLHDIGKNLVVSMLEGAGFEVTDLGIDVPPQRFIDAITERKPHIGSADGHHAGDQDDHRRHFRRRLARSREDHDRRRAGDGGIRQADRRRRLQRQRQRRRDGGQADDRARGGLKGSDRIARCVTLSRSGCCLWRRRSRSNADPPCDPRSPPREWNSRAAAAAAAGDVASACWPEPRRRQRGIATSCLPPS
jgi:hypothetical protein